MKPQNFSIKTSDGRRLTVLTQHFNSKITVVKLIEEAHHYKLMFTGRAKCNPVDEFNPHEGRFIALSRALQKRKDFKRKNNEQVLNKRRKQEIWEIEVLLNRLDKDRRSDNVKRA